MKAAKAVLALELDMIPVFGVAAVEGWSRNGNYYPAYRLKKLHGQTVPMLWCHEGTPKNEGDKIPEDKIIGYCTVYWTGNCLLYVGQVKDEFSWCVKLAQGASIGIHYQSDGLFVGDMTLEEVSLVMKAGIPATTLCQTDLASVIKLHSHLGARSSLA